MMMNPPTLPADYAPAVTTDDLVQALQLIVHATAPTPDDGGGHEAAYELAMAALKRVEARREYEAMHPSGIAQPQRTRTMVVHPSNVYDD